MTLASVFETERLIARPLLLTDLDDLQAICGDPAVMRYVGDLKPYSPEKTRRTILEAQASYRRHGFGAWAIVLRQTGRLIGFGGLEILPGRTDTEVTYILAADCWGQGLATEFAAAAIEHGFRRCGLREIGASFDPENRASMRVAGKVGMRHRCDGVDEYNLPTVYYVIENPDGDAT